MSDVYRPRRPQQDVTKGLAWVSIRFLMTLLIVTGVVFGWLLGWQAGLVVTLTVLCTLVQAGMTATESGRA